MILTFSHTWLLIWWS